MTAEARKERIWKMEVAGLRITARNVRLLTWKEGRKEGGREGGREGG